MNVRRPGFQLLSLAPAQLRHDDIPTYRDVPCLLPDQLRIYLSIYLPLLVVSIIFVCLVNISNCSLSWRSLSHEKLSSSVRHSMLPPSSPSSLSSTKFEYQDDEFNHEDSEELSPDYSSTSTSRNLPPPITSRSARASRDSPGWRIFTPGNEHQDRFHFSLTWNCDCLKVLLYFFRPGRFPLELHRQRRKRKSWLTATIRDIRDIAVFPLSVFVVITWLMVVT